MMRTTPELAPPLQASGPRQWEGVWPLRVIQRAAGPIHGGSSLESGFKPGALRSRSRNLTTRPVQPYFSKSPSAAAISTAGSADILSLSPPFSPPVGNSIRPQDHLHSAFLLATLCPTQKRWLYRNVEHFFMPWNPLNEKRLKDVIHAYGRVNFRLS
ncbi:hypothetical protein AVEN_14397-1 [Araneus ventricosus]|uniref:Uncharacterized protein n=1 Tax=Araneus ventricosus TaxID=182803 RepID=A0A4Y2RZ88_ARAVE|nr:hypothetical protein AVEN_14397-1 [Araneus ventricosus]